MGLCEGPKQASKWKSTCADCPEGHGEAWCNGVCVWTTQGGGNCVAKACCTSNTAECNACKAGVSVDVYCANNAHASVPGCGCILQGNSCTAVKDSSACSTLSSASTFASRLDVSSDCVA